MKFKKLYNDNRQAVIEALKAMWCGEPANESQQRHAEVIEDCIKQRLFAPSDAWPMVQCMNSWEISESPEDACALVGGLWRSQYAPYKHQHACWQALNSQTAEGKPMSICVTTGTGSGKTECFMLPLVKDLRDNPDVEGIKAIFLYPLNALMEDQKERLQDLLADTNLHFAVYNGDLPEEYPERSHPDYDTIKATIDHIRGVQPDGTVRFPNILATRKEVRDTPPDIMLTNPTMLEYILLRGSDNRLIRPEAKTLRWVVIDETHTYTGAGAAEMAMLLRRVFSAFNVKATDIRFATSSATFGNGKDDEEKLRKFIADMTGTSAKQVVVIGGHRIACKPEEEFKSLRDLYPAASDIETAIGMLDSTCDHLPQGERRKLHYYYRVPNNGLYVRLTDHENGAFHIYDRVPAIDTPEERANPLLELARCKHCGEYVAVGRYRTDTGVYSPVERVDSDMFDLDEMPKNENEEYIIVGLSRHPNHMGDNNLSRQAISIGGEPHLMPATNEDDWHLVVNNKYRCPLCGCSAVRGSQSDDDDAPEPTALTKFRLGAEFISRVMAPSILDNVEPVEGDYLHRGQQYLSFADSRQMAARSTLNQNLEQEKQWLYVTVYRELSRRALQQEATNAKIAALKNEMVSSTGDVNHMLALAIQIKQLEGRGKNYMTWNEVANLLMTDKYCDTFCIQFLRRGPNSDELNHGCITPEIRAKYVHSIMASALATHSKSGMTPENAGLFRTYYPQLENIFLPKAVEQFNMLIPNERNRIGVTDWRSLIRVFIDYTVRPNESFFFRNDGDNTIDIFALERFAATKPRRRPVKKPRLKERELSRSLIVRYLCALLAGVTDKQSMRDAYRTHYHAIWNVMEAFWQALTTPENHLVERGQHLKQGMFVEDTELADEPFPWRFNLVNISFALYDEVWLCDTNSDNSQRHVERLRPIGSHFKDFSPYMRDNCPVQLLEQRSEHWKVCPFVEGSPDKEKVKEWAMHNRRLLWDNGIWGNTGTFSGRLYDIHCYPDLFLQAEHTAQVDKEVSRKFQEDFKNHAINVLSCSTTMEMGVDLGDLEVVLLNSVPPAPSNYKQRSGRSGRNNMPRSACITLCSSDLVGLRTLDNPREAIIDRKVDVPFVDLQSPQVIGRHVNAFLIRAFKVFAGGEHGGSLAQRVIDYYTTYYAHRNKENNYRLEIRESKESPRELDPEARLGSETGTKYERFNQSCEAPLSEEIREKLVELLRDTCMEGKIDEAVSNAHKANKERRQELAMRIDDIARFWENSAGNDRMRNRAKMAYREVLLGRLLDYWATNRFTPNANMPVNVLSLNLDAFTDQSRSNNSLSRNPSYGLREALSQYCPGNTTTIDGVVYSIRGIAFTSMSNPEQTFKHIYHNTEKCSFKQEEVPDAQRWNVNEKLHLELIQPTGYLPDPNEERSRITQSGLFTRVNAQLIGANEWQEGLMDAGLYSTRSSRESGDAKILYYNEGVGYGFCVCSSCGRTILETEVANDTNLPVDMNPKEERDEEGNPLPRYHWAINKGTPRNRRVRGVKCEGSYDMHKMHRNVILGDLIQTDFTEIRLRLDMQHCWINRRDDSNRKLLTTLGVVLCQALVDYIGKERGAVDFTVMPNGHICVFDTNPGGAGYANQLAVHETMRQTLLNAAIILRTAQERRSRESLLDRYTMRHFQNIDIDAALMWVEKVLE